MRREHETDLWCPHCQTVYAQVFRIERGSGVWEHEKVPSSAPIYCPDCTLPIERKP
jgi:hypothetical protein